jgi:hypothetical protein
MSLLTDPRTPAVEAAGSSAPLALDPAQLQDIARGLATAIAVSPPVSSSDGRTWWRLLATEHFDAWLIDWPQGEAVEPHDHGGSAGAFAVVAGELTELVITGATTVVTTVAAGGTRAVGCHTVHDVVNRSEAPATSVHVYSPPLSSMMFYDPTGSPCRVEQVDPETPVWSVEPFSANLAG